MLSRSHWRAVFWIAILVWVGAGSVGSWASQFPGSEVRLEPIRGTPLMRIPVYVNQQGPFQFVLDTGADTTVIDSSLAKRLALPRKEAVGMRTVGGNWNAHQTVLEELRTGPARVSRFAVLEGDLSTVRSTLGGVQGILGQDVLLRFNYLLSYKDQSLWFESGDEIREALHGEEVRLESPTFRMVVEARTPMAEGVRLRLLLDSGANTLVLNQSAAAAAHVAVLGTEIETTPSAKLWMRSGKIEQLTVASRRFRNLPVTVTTLPQMEEICDGLLPTAFFRALYVNNREGFVEFIGDSRSEPAGR